MGGSSHLRTLTILTTNSRVAISLLQTFHFYNNRFFFKPSSPSHSSPHIHSRSFSVRASFNMEPPKPNKVKQEMKMFGDVRVDNYYWLRDDSRSNPDILAHLRQENAYCDHIMSGTKKFEDQIYSEIRGRLKEEDDISPPLQRELRERYSYYQRTLKEHVNLDENAGAQQHASDVDIKFSPNYKLAAYAEDTDGDEIFTVSVFDVKSQTPFGKPLVGVTSDFEWAGDDALVYTTRDDIYRADKVWLHKLGTQQSLDHSLYHEKDDMFYLHLVDSESKKFLFVASQSEFTNFIFYLDVSKLEGGLTVLTPRLDGIGTSPSHRGNHFFLKRRSEECFNSEILACPLDNTSATTVILPHRPSVTIQDMQLFTDHLVLYERENGLPKITIYRLPSIGEPLNKLQGGLAVDFIDPIYSLDMCESEFSSSILRYHYSSMRTPPSVYEYDMNSGISVLMKIDIVLGGFDSTNYITERLWATADDGTKIPISIVYRKELVKLDGSDPLHLYGYGSSEFCIDPSFNASRLSLLDRGFIFALAHIRGGGEMGRPWYEDGKLLKKKNTFTDFIACAEYLIEKKYSSKEKLCIEGRSAGGLLIGAVINMRPDLFKAAVAEVPFVDVLTTLLDPTIPHAFILLEEYGDPRKEEFYFNLKSYSPVDNIKAQNYPALLVTAGLNDTRVLYSQPAKFVAKLRDFKTDDNVVLFKCDFREGHFTRLRLREDALRFTFILKALDMIPAQSS